MKNSLLLFLFLFSEFCFAQNLVPNYSFEDTVTCPTNLDQVNKAVGWSAFRASPDYFNICSSSQFVRVPNTNFGYQYPRTGNGFIGLHCYHVRENIGVQLMTPLTIGETYYGSMYVVRALGGIPGCNVAINRIGMKLSTVPYSFSSPISTDNYAQIFANSVISDTLNWIEVSGSFIADSSYQYLSLGNFFNDSMTTAIFYEPDGFSYYFIDDVYLSTEPEGIPPINKNDGVTLFPNPTSNIINLSFPTFRDAEVSIYDRLGRRVFSGTVRNQNTLTLNLGAFSPGVYLLKLVSEKDGKAV
ncbi:MAG: T9SS type A sorting domain-containing protein, partial [Bacteroidia bacterium]|nr:T9SS type A sorting domain-containing protein [Bacteroidia bacterium]